jgi:hypothetical protein
MALSGCYVGILSKFTLTVIPGEYRVAVRGKGTQAFQDRTVFNGLGSLPSRRLAPPLAGNDIMSFF